MVVVDNASRDGSADGLDERYPGVEVVRLPENTGFAAANNLGLRRTTSEFVLLLNADTVVHPGAIEAMVAAAAIEGDIAFLPPTAWRARTALRKEHGGFSGAQVLFDLAEYQVRQGRDGYQS